MHYLVKEVLKFLLQWLVFNLRILTCNKVPNHESGDMQKTTMLHQALFKLCLITVFALNESLLSNKLCNQGAFNHYK